MSRRHRVERVIMNQCWRYDCRHLFAVLLGGTLVTACAFAGDHAQWGQAWTRNMVSNETGLVEDFDPATGRNVKWVVPLGSETWATPTVSQGRVFIGTNNDPPRDPRHKGDRSVLLCLDEKDGSLLWQLVVPKLGSDPYLDWPKAGIVSPATVEGNRVYIITNRGEAVCLDIEGQRNGNDGPYTDEGRHMVPSDGEPLEVTAIDADIIWLFDIPNQAGTWPHDGAHGSILIDGDFLYVNTSNGVDNTHRVIRRPEGPSLIVLDKRTGRLLARDNEGIGPRIFHSTWSSPAMGVVNGRKLVFFCGGDGVVYAFEPLQSTPPEGQVEVLKRVWRFDPDPTAPKENVSQYMGNREVSPSNIKSTPVFFENRLYVTHAGDIWWGKNQAWLKCIDATKTGDVTDSALVWSCELSDHCCSTPAVHDGLVYVADCGRMVRCIDAATGQVCWSHETKGDIWASTLVADGKVYVGTQRRDFWIFAAGREKKVLSEVRLDSAAAATPVAANGVLYVTTMKKLYALQRSP
ncbi:MAG TPA: PQQ-binding-like beta-propeller repeat protein [Sedimentisphaerales bacterium]|jgi:outer membrane protein assembly factor BamB|nr:PQQ-binding-like beta-propeller repeat protein [Sedimentisphaerales bacterium]HNU27936.1 PQQ-binding-like beta-propeller repeat protein [Sedimentisphaerales bacterium]